MAECIFCNIAKGNDPETLLLYEDEQVVVFKDHRPGAPHHYLAIPKEHIRDAKHLTYEHLPLVEHLEMAGKKVLVEAGGDIESARIGVHWPPVVFVSHIHLHILAPISQMKFLSRMLFRSDSLWFSSVEWLKNNLKSKSTVTVKSEDTENDVDNDLIEKMSKSTLKEDCSSSPS